MQIEDGAPGAAAVVRRPRQGALRAAAIGSWLVLAVLSLVPGTDRPHTGFSGNIEHAVAYALAGAVTRLAFRRSPSRWQVLAFALAAACFEIAQIWIPGRSTGLDNWAASSAGALCGIAAMRIVAHRLERRGAERRRAKT